MNTYMKYDLTNDEANTLKDILRVIGKDDDLNDSFAEGLGMSVEDFNDATDIIYTKLGNGRVSTK